ncbi:MAG: HAMP domain-containing histidine kinase [Bacteroidales bacterium]|jgi:signal transduction histidine kinase|nr:HAMP domain-containing histidine kinase [Bacteroidales bacterium]
MKNKIRLAVFLTCILLAGVVATQLYWLRSMYNMNRVQLETIANRAFSEAIHTEYSHRLNTGRTSSLKDEEQKRIFQQAVKRINEKDSVVNYLEKMDISGVDTVKSANLMFIASDSLGNWQERMANAINHLFPPDVEQIDSLFSKLLHKDYPGIQAAVELTDLAGDTVMQTVSADSITIGRNDMRTSVRSLDMYANMGIRGVIVSPQRALLARTAFALVLSLLFVVLALSCTGYLMLVIFRQNRYSQTVNDYIHHITHQLKAPISVALTTLRFLDADNGDNSQARHRLVELSEQSLEKLTSMVESLLFMSVQEQSHLRLNVEPFDLPAAVSRLAEEAELRAGKEVHINVDNQLPDSMVTADRLHLCDAVSNLIDNAIKYSGNRVDIMIRLYTTPGYTCISVKDNGIGIAPEHIGRIFDKFYRVDQPQAESIKGFGLGLSYVQAVCRAHGGHVEATSAREQESEFIIAISNN